MIDIQLLMSMCYNGVHIYNKFYRKDLNMFHPNISKYMCFVELNKDIPCYLYKNHIFKVLYYITYREDHSFNKLD